MNLEDQIKRKKESRGEDQDQEGIFRIYLQLSRIDSSIVLTSCSGAWPDDSCRGSGKGLRLSLIDKERSIDFQITLSLSSIWFRFRIE